MSNTGYKYIYFRPEDNKYQLKIWTGNGNKHCGNFATLEEAVKAREEKMKELGLTLYLEK